MEREIAGAVDENAGVAKEEDRENSGEEEGEGDPEMVEIRNHCEHGKGIGTEDKGRDGERHAWGDLPVPEEGDFIWKSSEEWETAEESLLPGGEARKWSRAVGAGVCGSRRDRNEAVRAGRKI
jgi:hypothetical protein